MKLGLVALCLTVAACGDGRDRDRPRHLDQGSRPAPPSDARDAGRVIPPNAPHLNLSPERLTWVSQGVDVGRTWWHLLVLANLGREPLLLHGLEIAPPFRVLLDDGPLAEHPEFLGDPDGDGDPGIAPGGSVEVRVEFAPLEAGEQVGELVLQSNDPRAEEHRVELRGLGVAPPPCQPLSPAELDFGEVPLGVETKATLRVHNCSPGPLQVEAIEVLPGPFSITLEARTLPRRIPAPESTSSHPGTDFELRFLPNALGPATGDLTVRTDAAEASERFRLGRLRGVGVPNQCPQAGAEAPRQVPLGEVVPLDGSPSRDPEGQDLRYLWSLVERPPGSLATLGESWAPGRRIPDSEVTPTAVLTPDRLGAYLLALDVTDPLGQSSASCGGSATVRVAVVAPQTLVVTARWLPERTDPDAPLGPDLDLHLHRPAPQQIWFGPDDLRLTHPGPLADDGSALGVAGEGGGPEWVSVPSPLPGEYQVAVHYYRQHDRVTGFDYGGADAEVSVWWGGERIHQAERRLERVNGFWVVAAIVMDPRARPDVRPIDRYSPVRP